MTRLTKQQKVAIAKRARTLISKGWTKGTWRGVTRGGNPAYCLEGACNQAAIDVLGNEAISLKAARPSYTGPPSIAHTSHFTRTLSVAKAARDYYNEKFGTKKRSLYAHELNDHEDTRKRDVIAVLNRYIAEHES